jgi:hypothetical protein
VASVVDLEAYTAQEIVEEEAVEAIVAPGAIESARAHHDDWQPPLSMIAERQSFAHQLGVLIVIQRGTGVFLVNDAAGDRATDDRYGGNVDKAAYFRLAGCFQGMMSAHHVGSVELFPRPPKTELGPSVYNLLTALTGSGHGLRIIQVPPNQCDSQPFEESIVTGGADEGPH